MERLLKRAERTGQNGEVPVAAVILDGDGRCIGHGGNTRERDRDPLGHAELVALRQASRLRGDWRFNDCTLIVTLEPCTMCAAALVQARMGAWCSVPTTSSEGDWGEPSISQPIDPPTTT